MWRRRHSPEEPDALIDAEELVAKYSVEELAATAEDYYTRIEDKGYHFAKPYGSAHEAPMRLGVFGPMLQVLELTAGDVVLDFGAGTGWTSHTYAQLGCEVIACDVSQTALNLGRELFKLQPPISYGPTIDPRFLLFDGRRFDLEDASVDRIARMDALHHIANRTELLAEMFRVLRPGGRAAVFAEPGPDHSRLPQSQMEMRNFTAVERNIVVAVIDAEARGVGFNEMHVGIFNPMPFFVRAEVFDRTVEVESERMASETREFLKNNRLLVLDKPGTRQFDSRRRLSLACELTIEMRGTQVRAHAHDSSDAVWLASGEGVGPVNLGIHLFDGNGQLLDLDFQRVHLSDVPVEPGESVDVTFDVTGLAPGSYRLEFDLVAEGVAWFAEEGGRPVTHRVDIT